MAVADDIGHLGGIGAVDHLVDGHGDQRQGDHAIQRTGQIPEDQGVRHRHQNVDGKTQGTDAEALQLQLQQPGRQLRTAGGGPLPQHDAAGDADDDAAVQTGQNGLHRLEGMHRRQTVDHQRADGRGIDGGEQEILADEPPAQHEQRHVEDNDDGADGQARQQVVDDLPQTGEAAHADVVGVKHPVEPHGIQGAGRRDDEILRQDVPFHRLLLFSYSRVSCSSPRSSGRRRAPVPGMLRAR